MNNNSSECEDILEVNGDVPDELDEAGVHIGYCDSDDTVDYDSCCCCVSAAQHVYQRDRMSVVQSGWPVRRWLPCCDCRDFQADSGRK